MAEGEKEMSKRKTKISTFDKSITIKEAEREKRKPTALGKSLRKADQQYSKRRKT
jgi:hypothetical protein